MNSLHVVAAVRARDLTACAMGVAWTRYENGVFRDTKRDMRIVEGPFATMNEAVCAAYERAIGDADANAYGEIVLFVDPLPDLSCESAACRRLAALLETHPVRIERVHQSQSRTCRELVDATLGHVHGGLLRRKVRS